MPAPRKPSWTPPPSIDEYRLLDHLGGGAMGNIYLARDSLLERLVAVKFIAAARPGSDARHRFRVEARAIARLSHPNVVAVYRSGEVDGRPYLVTEFVRGHSLAELPGPLPPENVLRIALGLARGLAAAHRQGVLHRDIKPANVMLTEEGEVKLVDFGLAKLLQSSAEADTPPGAPMPLAGAGDETPGHGMVGTPRYMAPEVLSGEPATRQSDLFSVGAVLYELCTGTPPRPRPAEGEDWTHATAVPLGSLPDWKDTRLAALVDRCLDMNPARRFASADALCTALAGLIDERSSVPVPEGNPYRGLQAFEAEHRALFFGRSEEAAAIIERLRTEPLVVVAGDSGVGKSSLCRAGVLPGLADSAAREGRHLRSVVLVPGRAPVQALAVALASALEADEAHFGRLIREEPRGLGVELRRMKSRDGRLVLFVDQLEELFTLAPLEEATLFAEAVASIGAVAAGAHVLMAIRGDFFTRLASLPGLGSGVSRALYLLPPLSAEAMREAIVSPAQRKGVGFESEQLIQTLTDSAVRAAGGLPLLQFAMAELWEARDEQRKLIPEAALQAIGGVGGALARHANGAVAALLPEERRAARKLLLRLVTPEGMRVRRSAEELESSDARASTALEALIRARLVVARGREEETRYELAHEALVHGWDALRHWMHTDVEQREQRERIEAAAVEWTRQGRAAEALWSARQLAEAVRVSLDSLTPRASRFLEASRAAVRRQRIRRAMAAVVVPLLVVVSLSGVWFQARRELEAKVVQDMSEAERWAREGRRLKRDALRLRAEAFALFDKVRGTPDDIAEKSQDAEEMWGQALNAAKAAEESLARAVRFFETAYRLEPARSDIQAALGDVLVERIEMAEVFHHEERRSDLLRPLPAFDPEGSRVRSVLAPPRLDITSVPPGAEVFLERYEDERGRKRLVPVGSLGRTPLEGVVVEQGAGSYRLTLRLPGRATTRYPILLARAELAKLSIPLPEERAVPRGFVHVPAGSFLVGSAHPDSFRRGLLNTQPLRRASTGAFLISRTEVTFEEWLAFLKALPPAQRRKHLPLARQRDWVGLELTEEPPGGRWRLRMFLDAELISAWEGEPFRIPKRSRRAVQDWLRFPVSGISRADAGAYLAWLDETGRVPGARLCGEWEWERAARGADGRSFPHGDYLLPDDANYDETYGRVSGAFGPDEVGSHPASESPFGVMDLTGNVYEWVRSQRSAQEAVLRGGMWYFDSVSNLVVNRTLAEPNTKDIGIGLRVCADVPR